MFDAPVWWVGWGFVGVRAQSLRLASPPDLEALCERFVAEQNALIAEANAAVPEG